MALGNSDVTETQAVHVADAELLQDRYVRRIWIDQVSRIATSWSTRTPRRYRRTPALTFMT